jgi:PAS domain S-box-containing protein
MTLNRLTILLIDDNPADAERVRGLIAEFNAEVEQIEQVTQLDAALDRLQHACYDAVLFDLGSGDPLTLTRLAAVHTHSPTTPVVALIDDDNVASELNALRAGAHECLGKSRLSRHALLRAIHIAIERGQIGAQLAAKALYRTLVEHIPLAVYMIGHDGLLQIINATTAYMLGFSNSAALAGRPFLELLPRSYRDHVASLMARAFAGERMEIEYTQVIRAQRRVFAITLIPIIDAASAVHSLMGMTQDITDQLEMRLDAEIERDRLSAAIESTNDAVVMFDLDRRLTLVNHAWSTLFKVGDRDLIGLTDELIFEQLSQLFEQPERVLVKLNQLFDSPQNEASGEVAIHCPEQHTLAWYSIPVRTGAGTSLGRLFVFRDVTREKKADQMKSEFVSIVSHELRTPLTSIKGFTDLILEGDVGPVSPQVREFLEIVQSSADQLVAITNDILETSRIEAGRITIDAQPLDVAETVHLIADSIQVLMADKQQTLVIDLSRDLPLVSADRDRLAQILTNLISNAQKYTPANGSIRIHAYLAENLAVWHPARAEASGPWLVVCITDTGIGIAPQDQEQLFTRFYRVNNPSTQGISGTGLGLNITQSLVELHGGRIWLESEPNRGSTFFFSLPTVAQLLS